MDPQRRRGALSILLACAALAACAVPASAAQVTASVAPASLGGAPPYNLTYTFQLQTALEPEELTFTIDGPDLAQATISGPGVISATGLDSSTALQRCTSGRGFAEGPSDYTTTYSLTLPPASTSTLSVTTTRRTPLALGEGLGYQFALGPDLTSLAPVGVADPQLDVPRVAPLSITARRVRGGRVVVRGTTTPLLAGQQIALRYATRWPAARYLSLARVRVARDGSFGYTRWTPPRRGVYTVKPFYHSHDPRFVSGSASCGATVRVR